MLVIIVAHGREEHAHLATGEAAHRNDHCDCMKGD